MILRSHLVYPSVFVVFSFIFYCDGNIILNADDHGYENIQISVNDNLQEHDCEYIIDNIKSMFEEASDVLVNATHDYSLWFKSATVVIPETWKSCGPYPIETVDYAQVTDPQIVIGSSHPIFGDNPWTSQPRQCGLPGDYIYLSQQWLEDGGDYSDKLLVHEWAKLRWGVFEEYGIQGDDIFPPVYLQDDASSPNYCTDVPLDAEISDCTEDKDCVVVITDPQDPPVKTSLMSLRNHSQVHEFCDGSTHSSSPTKHQLLCDGESVWDILLLHPDFAHTSIKQQTDTKAEFKVSVVKQKKLEMKIMIVINRSYATSFVGNMWDFLRDSVSDFLANGVPNTGSIGIVSFSSEAELIYPLTSFSDEASRKKAVSVMQNLPPNINEYRQNKTLALALASSELNDDGIILLVTNDDDQDIDSNEDILDVVGGNSLWPIIYPNNGHNVPKYEYAAAATGGQLSTVGTNYILDDTYGKMLAVSTLLSATHTFRQVLNYYHQRELQYEDDDYRICLDNTCRLRLTSPSGSGPDVIVSIYNTLYGVHHVDAGDENNLCEATPSLSSPTLTSYQCRKEKVSDELDIFVGVNSMLVIQRVTAELTALNDITRDRIDVWTSHDFTSLNSNASLQYTIYAKVLKDNYEVVRATVSGSITVDHNILEIYFNDDGTQGDVTGNDGIYTYVLSHELSSFKGSFKYHVSAVNSNKSALITSDLSDSGRVCCGSKIQLPNNLPKSGEFHLQSAIFYGFIEEMLTPKYLPGQITDLVMEVTDKVLTFEFTSTGEELYYGNAKSYNIHVECLEINETSIINVDSTPKPAGQVEKIVVYPPICDALCVYRVSAINSVNVEGKLSNQVRNFMESPCLSPPPIQTTSTMHPTLSHTTTLPQQPTDGGGNGGSATEDDPLEGWAIALIVVACIVAVLPIVLFGYKKYKQLHHQNLRQ